MAKKKSCQNVRNPRVLSPAERELYDWVDAEVFTQSFVVTPDHLPELCREMRLTQDLASERDYVLEAAGPSDRLPFQVAEDRTHFLWAYVELFTHMGVRFPFSNFQREVLMWCQVASSQLHLNGWGFLRTFERVCLHFGFRLSWRIFLYTYQLHAPPPGNRFCPSAPTRGDDFLMPLRSLFRNSNGITSRLCLFLVAVPFGLTTRGSRFPGCTEIRSFSNLFRLDWGRNRISSVAGSWITAMLKFGCSLIAYSEIWRNRAAMIAFCRRRRRQGTIPRSVLPHIRVPQPTSGGSSSSPAILVPAPATSVPPAPSSSAAKTRGKPLDATAAKPFSVEREEGAKEDPAADLRQKRRKRKVSKTSAEEAALGGNSAWKHKVDPIDCAFPPDYNFRATLDAGLTNGPIREILGPLVPEQLLGTAQLLACQLTACLQVCTFDA
ncbi:hypothetical protein PIB30_061508 [Stylosanthes scabra]|uniref:Uncharacterized protein n=1 Tax=Stylosanthes scabra TaxID=79078 RepID=A0ABU6TLH2_9FABA|nr:hypothetical protein [Stylosanthes scabra]